MILFAAMENATPLERTLRGKISLATTQVTGPMPREKLAMKKQSANSVIPAAEPPACAAPRQYASSQSDAVTAAMEDRSITLRPYLSTEN